MLTGVNEETALGRTVQIRAEKDPKKIREMTNHEKKIRSDWQEFKRKQQQQQTEQKKDDNYIYLTKENISKVFSNIFK